MEVTIGNLVQIESVVFALELGESAWLKFRVGEKPDLELNVRLLVGKSGASRIFGEGTHGVLEIPEPQGPFGYTSAEPIYMGRHGGRESYLSYQCYPYSKIMQICIQIYIENE